MKRIFITGGSGFIGSHLARKSVKDGWEVMTTCRSHPLSIDGCEMQTLDLANRAEALSAITSFKPDVIIHTAANASLDHCEEHPESAWRDNVTATENIVGAADSCKAFLVFTSTDAVFDGERGVYSEEDTPNPINVYSETKLHAEGIVLSRTDAAVVRTSINYGHRLASHQGSFFQDILNALQDGRTIPVFYDQYRNPIEVDHFAAALLDIAEIRYSGLLHVAGSQRCSRKEFAEAVCRHFGLSTDLLIPKSQDEVAFKVKRSRDISMRVEKAMKLLHVPLPDLEMGMTVLHSKALE